MTNKSNTSHKSHTSNTSYWSYFVLLALIFSYFPLVKTAHAATISRPPSNLGLVGYWPMDEGTGNKAGDASGSGNTGTISGATWTNGKHGKGMNFDGNDYANMGTNSNLDITDTFVLSFWMNINAVDNALVPRVISKAVDASNFYMIGVNSGNTGLWAWYSKGGVGYRISSSNQIGVGNWAHVLVSYNTGVLKMYINGVDVTVVGGGPGTPPSSSSLSIGAFQGGSPFYNGKLDDVRIYNRTLSATEISKMYSSGQVISKKVSESGLVGYWAMNEGQGSKVGDSSGNGYNGTLESGITWAPGKKGQALQFSNAGLNTSPSATINRDSFTASAWFKTTSTGDQKILSNNVSYHQIQVINGHLRICVNGCTEGSTAINDNKWHFVIVVGNGSGIYAYLDGSSSPEITQVATSGAMTGTFSIGKVGNGDVGTFYYFNGSIDDVRVYNRALSAGEIQNLYKQNETMVNAPQNDKLTNGLVGLWSFNGKDVSGSTAYDRSGQGNHGTITGAKLDAGKVGQALDFGSSFKYMTGNGPNKGTGLTLSAWVNPRQYSAEMATIILGNQYYLSLYTDGSLNSYWYGTSYEGYHATIAGKVPLNKWSYVTATWDGSKAQLYVDGVLEKTVNVTGLGNNPAAGSLRIGAESESRQFIGSIDEARIYNRALSASEIKQLYLMGK